MPLGSRQDRAKRRARTKLRQEHVDRMRNPEPVAVKEPEEKPEPAALPDNGESRVGDIVSGLLERIRNKSEAKDEDGK